MSNSPPEPTCTTLPLTETVATAETSMSGISGASYWHRPKVSGKFLSIGDEKYWVKGVTYGTFCPNADGDNFPDRERVAADFASMSSNGINSVRTYTPPPRWLLDLAQSSGLRVMVGLSWEQHVTFLDDRKVAQDIVLLPG